MLVFLFLTSGCLGTKSLKENQFLLYEQQIEGNSKFKDERLEDFFLQKPNPRVPFTPISIPAWVYHVGLSSFDTAKVKEKLAKEKEKWLQKIENTEEDRIRKLSKLENKRDRKIDKYETILEDGNFLMRRGEAPAVYDPELAEGSKEELALFYFSEGYFNAKVSYNVDTFDRKIYEQYNISEGDYYRIDTLFYQIPDSSVLHLIKIHKEESFLIPATRYRQENFEKERDRLESLLKNNGYFDFSRQYIEFNLDTTYNQRGVATQIAIRNPINRNSHKVFSIDSVLVITDSETQGSRVGEGRTSATFNGITYSYFDRKYNERILDRRLEIRPNELYSRKNTLETQRKLFNLDLFKFANVVYDTSGSGMQANIYMSPLPKWQFSTESGVNVTQGLPGPMINFNLRDRNVLKSLGILEFTGRFNVEGVAGAATQENVFRSIEMGSNLSLILPGVVAPFSRSLPRKFSDYNPRTRISIGFTSTNRPEYNRGNYNATFGYQWVTSKNHSFTLNLMDVSIIESRIKSQDFQDRLEELLANGNNLIFSFQTSFQSSINAQSIFNFNEYGNKTKTSSLLRFYGESAGNLLNLYRSYIEDNLGLLAFRYLKGQAEFRQHIPFNRDTQFAWRANVGVAYSFNEGSVLPYEKYFFSGGSNSIRAWAPRRLGPGSYLLVGEDGRPDYRFEAPGEILLELSAELRRKLFGFVHGAIFVDAGNVWFVKTEPVPGARFDAETFLEEIGIGTGLGLRLDFEFLIMRFDAGIKAYNPGLPKEERWVIKNLSWDRPFGLRNQTVFNIAIGYPF
jgi:outer membrane protein assembly factor BamA